MRVWLITGIVLLLGFSAQAYTSGIAITTEKAVSAQVYVNGKLCNKTLAHFIRIKSPSGSFNVRVKLYNSQSRKWQEFEQTIRVDRGFEHYFTIAQPSGKRPHLIQVKRYPTYSKYFLNYSLYLRSNTT